MNEEEKVFFKFTESKILLKEFCEEYVKVKKNEELLTQQMNKIQLKNYELENEIEKYKELIKNIERKKDKEMENYNFEYDIKIKKLAKEMDFLNSCLNKEKENNNLKATELIGLKLENEKYKIKLCNKKENNIQEKDNTKLLTQSNINVLNKIYTDINQKVENIMKHLNETKNNRHDIEQKIKNYQSVLNEYLKKITEINLKYEKFYKLYKEAHFKNILNKSKNKLLKCQIEELKSENKLLSNQILTLKKSINSIDVEKTQYYLLLKKAEKKNLFFYHKFDVNKMSQESEKEAKHAQHDVNQVTHISSDTPQKISHHSNMLDKQVQDNTIHKSPKEFNKNTSIYKYRQMNTNKSYRSDEFNIKKERKRKKILFFSDNDYDKRKKRKNQMSNAETSVHTTLI
ncbi:hypothetical protein, conserved [Plasmodium gonderi]|uniref:Uncharacterized protein n=1 Tax=Plasmodium gonderi TaxID=77519 RepID=A0A1Y1JK38_PLAGO|nr:hypothetical protein, conserved [Plasmodium gonderi]GAW81567.1 hypothetical protein, conserved [Plasmodium gonderi]